MAKFSKISPNFYILIGEAIPKKEERLEKIKSSADNVNAFIEKAKKYKSIDTLTPEIVRLFIARIEIGECSKKHSRYSTQKIRIVYCDIGEWYRVAETEEKPPQCNETISKSA